MADDKPTTFEFLTAVGQGAIKAGLTGDPSHLRKPFQDVAQRVRTEVLKDEEPPTIEAEGVQSDDTNGKPGSPEAAKRTPV